MRIPLIAAAGALLAFATSGASAGPLPVDRLANAPGASLVQDAQYYYSGRQYCFYPNGWRGPGFYLCGFNWRRGYGWGGPMGWRGWGGPAPRYYERPRPRREFRPEYRREFRRF